MQNKTDSFEISLEQRYIHNYFTFWPQKKLGNKFNVFDSQQAAGESPTNYFASLSFNNTVLLVLAKRSFQENTNSVEIQSEFFLYETKLIFFISTNTTRVNVCQIIILIIYNSFLFYLICKQTHDC